MLPFHYRADLMQTPAGARILVSSSDTEDSKPTADQFKLQSLLLDQVQLALIVRDLEDRICFWNKGAERLYGWRAGENVYDLLFPRELQVH